MTHRRVRALVGACLLLAGLGSGALRAQVEDPTAHHPDWFKNSFLDLREDVAEAAAKGKRVMLYFYQQGCPYCARLLQDNLGQRSIAEKTRRYFDVIAINMWGDREVTGLDGRTVTEKQFAVAMGVQFTPTLLMLDEQGRRVLRINGYYPPHKFDLALDYAGQGMERHTDFRSLLASEAPAPSTGLLHVEPDYVQPPYRLQGLAARQGRPLLVLFEQRHCSACDELHLDVFKREESRELLKRFAVVVLDMWSGTPVQTPDGKQTSAREWARELGIQYAPSLVFFDAEGREVFRSEAYLRAFHVQSVLDYVASGAYREQPQFQRYLSERADALREQGVEVDLME